MWMPIGRAISFNGKESYSNALVGGIIVAKNSLHSEENKEAVWKRAPDELQIASESKMHMRYHTVEISVLARERVKRARSVEWGSLHTSEEKRR